MSEFRSPLPGPCPWCGGDAAVVDSAFMAWVKCGNPDCRAEGPTRMSAAEAIEAWNRVGAPEAVAVGAIRLVDGRYMISASVDNPAGKALPDKDGLYRLEIIVTDDQLTEARAQHSRKVDAGTL